MSPTGKALLHVLREERWLSIWKALEAGDTLKPMPLLEKWDRDRRERLRP